MNISRKPLATALASIAAFACLASQAAHAAPLDLDPLGPTPAESKPAQHPSKQSAPVQSVIVKSGARPPMAMPVSAPAVATAPTSNPASTSAATPPAAMTAPAHAALAAQATLTPAAVTAMSAEKSVTFRQLDELRTRNAILALQVQEAELQAKLKNPGGTGQTSQQANGAMPTPQFSYPGAATPGAAAQSSPASAQVVMVSGPADNLTAVISLPEGGTIKARVGQDIAGIGRVVSIDRNQVVVGNKSKQLSLPFAVVSYTSGAR